MLLAVVAVFLLTSLLKAKPRGRCLPSILKQPPLVALVFTTAVGPSKGLLFRWFKQSFLPNIGTARPHILILDGHDSHNFMELIDAVVDNDIHIIELPAHASNRLQSCYRTGHWKS